MENVKNLLSINRGFDFLKLQIELDEIGYDVEWSVLDSAEVVPQHRERIFIVGHLRGRCTRKVFPIIREDGETNNPDKTVKQVGNTSSSKYLGDNPQVAVREATKIGYDIAGIGDSINFAQPNSKTRRGRVGHGVANTLTTSVEQATLTDDLKIRKLTPLECWRLQGFPDWAFNRAREVGLSDSQLYKQAGNSVTVPVIKTIAERMELP
ncbi:DNA cytosine methyltransferase [Lactiplantibacillus argentoratensis]|uniref:DNA cytosine methyltransferase n=1 Tax=Lactiplantibacillus argentoratensis TaxID=271881 RepID=UPI003D7D34D2